MIGWAYNNAPSPADHGRNGQTPQGSIQFPQRPTISTGALDSFVFEVREEL
jgi:hypothetical protein